MILNLDHIAIAVPELEAAIRRFAEDLGLALSGTEDVPSAETTTAFFPVSVGSRRRRAGKGPP